MASIFFSILLRAVIGRMRLRVLVVASVVGADASTAAGIVELSVSHGAATSVELAVLRVSDVRSGWIVWLLPTISWISS